jgi:hypothetical protein
MRINEGSASGDQFGLRPAKGTWAGVRKSLSRLGNLMGRSRTGVRAKGQAGAGVSAHTLELLSKKKLFERLDERLCPADSTHARAWCQGGFELTARILSEAGIEPEQVEPILQELAANGSSCDCGVLFNAAQESRLKTEYWLARALTGEPFDPHSQLHRK